MRAQAAARKLPRRTKAPRIKRWQKLNLSMQDIPEYFGARDNIGVLLGEGADWLVDVDLDALEAVTIAGAFLPNTDRIHGRPGKPRSHWFYRAEGVKTRRYNDPQGHVS